MATTVVPWVTGGLPLACSPSKAGGVRPLRRRSSLKLGPGSLPGLNVGTVIASRTLQAAGSRLGPEAAARGLLAQRPVDSRRAVLPRRRAHARLKVLARGCDVVAEGLSPRAVGVCVARRQASGPGSPVLEDSLCSLDARV